MFSESVQKYLKAIYKLEEETGNVTTTGIAKELAPLTGASVTGMLKRLSAMGLVDYNSYKGVKLTDSGRKISLEIIRHHRLLELYLKEMLGFSLEKVHEEADRLEKHISEDFINKIDDLLGNPEFDPHGHPIPTKKGEIADISETTLAASEAGKKYIIRWLGDDDEKMLAYFEETGLMPNVKLNLISKAPFNGPISIQYDGKELIIGNELASNIFVEVTK
jgi:DtxR family transcriptional regulator, Mn-dependent transcriptional regulator